MKQMLKDYDIEQGITSIHYDNSSVSNISQNLIFHSQTKYIEIHHHFIRDLVEDTVCPNKTSIGKHFHQTLGFS